MVTPLEQTDPVHRRDHPARGRTAEHDGPADRVRELHVAGGARGAGFGADEQVLRGLSRRSATTAAITSSTTPRTLHATGLVRACSAAEHANVQPHSGANANMAAFLAMLEPGDKVMGMRLDQGGHLTHGSPVNFSGRFYDFVAYGVDDDDRDARLRRDPGARQAGDAEDDHRRGDGVLADHRLRGVPFDRRRCRRAAARRRGAHRRADRRWRASVAVRARRRRDVHDAQDAARAREPARFSARRSTRRRSTRRCSRACRADR